jgi:hypothetical protein
MRYILVSKICFHKFQFAYRYHPGCIDRWLGEHRTCPVCKWDITAAGGEMD